MISCQLIIGLEPGLDDVKAEIIRPTQPSRCRNFEKGIFLIRTEYFYSRFYFLMFPTISGITQGRRGTCRVGGRGKLKDFPIKFKTLSLPTAEVRKFYDEALKFPKI